MSEFDYTQEERFDRDIVAKLYSSFFAFEDATFVIGADAGTTLDVAVQIVDLAGQPVLKSVALEVIYTSEAAPITPDATSGAWTIVPTTGVGSITREIVANSIYDVQTDANGLVNLRLTEAGGLTGFLAVKLLNGSYAVSDAVDFTA